MQKTRTQPVPGTGSPWAQQLLCMKLTLLLTLFCTLQAFSKGEAQVNVSLNLREAKLSKIFGLIEQKTQYRFIYNDDILPEQKFDLRADNEPVIDLIEKLLKNLPLSYRLAGDGKLIVIGGRQLPLAAEETTKKKAYARIAGQVTDNQNNPLAGVSVNVKDTDLGTVSDTNGNFVLNIPDNVKPVLVLTYVGYEPTEVTATPGKNLVVVLGQNPAGLNEVVVIGYGTQKREKLIGSVSQLSGQKIENRTVPNLSQAITGQMPGVTVVQRSGQPGTAGGIQIRGVGSFTASTSPLILIDGIPASSFNDVDPNDVENVSVLKDASSAAIYGARAANGVILVTTKTGKSDKLKIAYNGYTGLQQASALPQFVSSGDYAELTNEAVPNSYTAAQIQKFRDGSDPDNYPNSDYIGPFFKNAVQTGHNISLSNGNKNSQYLLSFGYMYQNGIVEKNDFNRYNARLNLTSNLSSKLKLTTRLSAIQTIDKQPAPPATLDFNNMAGIISQVVRYASIYTIRKSNGDWGEGLVNKGNPFSYLQNDSYYKGKTTDLNANLRLDWQVLKDLKLSLIGGYTQLAERGTRFLATQRVSSSVNLGPSIFNETFVNNNYKTIQALADYSKTFGKHEFGLLGGYSYEENFNESLGAGRTNLPSNSITVIDVGDASTQTNTGSASEWALESYFGRLRYNYDSKYLLEGTVRYDGSSRFPPSNKYAAFPSVAVGWRLSEENFIKDNFEWINELKLKASYGILGNQNIGNYPYQRLLNSGFNYPIGSAVATGVALTSLIDISLRWESTQTTDIGVEFSVLNRKLSFSATWFDKYTYDILVSPASSVSAVLGFGVGVQNSGELRNRGWEFNVEHRNEVGSFSYGAAANFSVINNTVLDLGVGNIKQPNGLTGNGTTLFIGYPLDVYYGYVADGLFVDQQDVTSWYNQSAIAPNAKPGDIRYRDISGPDGKPDGKVDAIYDRTILGSTIPKYTYGLNLDAGYKNFDFSVLLQGVSSVSGNMSGYAGYAFYNTGNVQTWMKDERWTTANPNRNAGYPRMELITNSGTNNTLSSSYWTLNASYLRIKAVRLGYSVPTPTVKRWGMSALRVNLSAENLFTFSDYREGWDPEINSAGAFYPILRNFTFGVSVNF